VVSLSKEVALKAASAMLMMEATEIDNDVIDAVGEIANMVAGSAKAELAEFELSISLPSVITGRGHEVRFPSNVTPICVPFDTEWGQLYLEVGLTEACVPACV
ncbi:MAG TPA: chemotaxis protein CheX, partial [Pirellulaceae bacterium]|nr:chemotaxis protein CheX [Pirellulaceae bacterium]